MGLGKGVDGLERTGLKGQVKDRVPGRVDWVDQHLGRVELRSNLGEIGK